MFKHTIVYAQGTVSKPRVLKEFNVGVPFGKLAGILFRQYVRDQWPEAKLIPRDRTIAGFHYTLNDGDTIELR